MNIIAFGASTSRTSINQQFAHWAAHQFKGTVNMIDLNDFEMPLYSIDREIENGIPEEAYDFIAILEAVDLIILSLAEHNGNMTAAFKNTFDWASRSNVKVFKDKPVFLLSTSPGEYAGKNSLQAGLTRFPRHGAEIITHFSLPSFGKNFENGITESTLLADFNEKVNEINDFLSKKGA